MTMPDPTVSQSETSAEATEMRGNGPASLVDLLPDDGDMFLIVRDHGRAATAFVRHGDSYYRMPGSWETTYAPEGGLKPIRVTAKFGWTQKQWKEIDRA